MKAAPRFIARSFQFVIVWVQMPQYRTILKEGAILRSMAKTPEQQYAFSEKFCSTEISRRPIGPRAGAYCRQSLLVLLGCPARGASRTVVSPSASDPP